MLAWRYHEIRQSWARRRDRKVGRYVVLLDELMPRYEFEEVHSIRLSAPPERALDAVKQATPGEMPLVRLLFAIRSLPAIFSRGSGLPTGRSEPLWKQMLNFGFVLLGEERGRELVASVVAQPWRLGGGPEPHIRNADEFVAFERSGYMKAAMNFSVGFRSDHTELQTETRVLTTDPASRRSFGRYWRVIYPGSAAIRRSWLRAAKRRAESGAESYGRVAQSDTRPD